MNATYTRTAVDDLKVGDVIETWWTPGRDIITHLEPYLGNIDFLRGARIARFALNNTGMTLEAGRTENVLCQP